ncbi:hypothetical protein D8674_030420 [Pyrus ussuriensis x Pyrus communis]|uniref:CCHC-type domain-containing protein n=1 Tax=Pyrus ussuriensis x Pyrus communis TaxID=2448454 RepID=A0A5N5F195_9ROSA|nr:hypothetical protein D8674_030420 [Pyrus ussuriensis x Pyrus communis]
MLGLMDYDHALREDEPPTVAANNTAEQRLKSEKWEKSNRMALMVMKRSISEVVRGGIPSCDKAKAFLEAVGAKFKMSKKEGTTNLMTTLTSQKFDGKTSVREHILKMVEDAAKLKDLEVPIDDSFVVHMSLSSLPESFEQLKVLDEMISICAQKDIRLNHAKSAVVNLVDYNASKNPMVNAGKQTKPFNTSTTTASVASSSRGPQNLRPNLENVKCYFCKQYGHLKRDCKKRKKWAVKKGKGIFTKNVNK